MKSEASIFERYSIPRTVFALALPTVLSQLITVIYNLADTFYIGQLNDPSQVAAIAISMPLFMVATAIANLFGIGGASLISRSLGQKNEGKAKKASTFAFYGGIVIALLYSLGIYLFRDPVLRLLGSDSTNYTFCFQYIFWVIVIGAIPTVLNSLLAHLIRAEGHSAQASIGIALGGIMNIILDPIFIFDWGFGLNVVGAAIAMMISNGIAMCYFLIYIIMKRKESVVSLKPKNFTFREGIAKETLAIGIPASLMTLMATVSNIVVNTQLSMYRDDAMIAGMGIAKKANMITFAVSQGLTQGVLPLIGYTYGAKQYSRLKKSVFITGVYAITFSICILLVGTLFPSTIIRFFIQDPNTVSYGSQFLQIICIAAPFAAFGFLTTTTFQGTGQHRQAFLLSILRKGAMDIPLIILLHQFIGMNGIAWGTPIAEFFALIITISLLIPFLKKLGKNEANISSE